MLISPPFLPQHSATEYDEQYLPVAMNAGGFGDGSFPLGLNLSWHGGVHLLAPSGPQGPLPVRAIADGVVAYVRQPKPMPALKADVEKDPLGYNGWTDNGCVIIQHETEIGEDVTVRFYSIILHLSKVSPGIKTGQKVWRKDELGKAGYVDGEPNRIQLEIICDDANLALLVGRSTGPLPTHQDGRTDSVFGEVYVTLPQGAAFYTEQPAAHQASPPPSTSPAYRTTEDYVIGIRYTGGKPEVTTYKSDGSTVGTAEGTPDIDLYDIANAIAEAYAHEPIKPAPVAVYELWRFGRVIGPDTLQPADVPHWRQVAYPGGKGWVNLHTAAAHAFSDADFPHWRGWQLIDDDTQLDSRCDSKRLIDLVLEGTPDHGAQDTSSRRIKALNQLPTDDVQARVARTICKFPTEWEKSSVAARWQWLTKETPPDGDRMTGPYLHQEDFSSFQKHAEALSFWEEAKLDIPSLHWHFHPLEFIRQFRQCGWLSKNEMIQLFPMTAMRPSKGGWVSENISINKRSIDNYRKYLNKSARLYVIDTPLRMASFYANILVETGWLSLLEEKSQDQRYLPWNGRGFMQLTWPSNYIKYWHFKGKVLDHDLVNKLYAAEKDSQSKKSSKPLELIDQLLPVEMKIWRDVDLIRIPEAADSAGIYWSWSQAAHYADKEPTNVHTFKKINNAQMIYYSSTGFGSVAATVNVGHASAKYETVNGIVARFQAYTQAQVTLLDTPTFPRKEGSSAQVPENFQPRRP